MNAAHEDVKARYRWAEQLAGAARDQALAQLRVDVPAGAAAHAVAFNAGPRAAQVMVETQVPVALLDGEVAARGPDGVLRPVQLLGGTENRPIFEGEFPASELAQYLGGVDPRTPLFGKYLLGITANETSPGTVRLDVGLADTPVTPVSLVEDQRRVEPLLKKAERFKVLMHYGALSRPALVSGGPAPELSLVPNAIVAGKPAAELLSPANAVRKLDGSDVGMACGPLSVRVLADGIVEVHDASIDLRVRANDLVDDGDRGDLYHCDPVGKPLLLPTLVRATWSPRRSPLRGRIVVEQTLDDLRRLISELSAARATTTVRRTTLTTTVTLSTGSRAVELSTTVLDNALDRSPHPCLRACAVRRRAARRRSGALRGGAPPRSIDAGRPAGRHGETAGADGPAPPLRRHLRRRARRGAVDLARPSRARGRARSAGRHRPGADALALGRLAVARLICGSSTPPPAPILHRRQPQSKLGAHRFDYAVLAHAGDWQQGGVMPEARRFASPPLAVTPKGKFSAPPARALVDVSPDEVTLTGVYPAETGRGTVVRVVNNSGQPREATLRLGFPAREVLVVDPLERPAEARFSCNDGVCTLPLGPWQIATLLFRS